METANFYLAPTRAWELFAGSIATFVVRKRGVQGNNLLSLLGLAAIMFAIFAYDESTPFPSVYALVPVVGVVFLLLFAQRTTLVGKFLSTKPFVGIGLISYSAYLWHQPLFAFIRINSLEKPSTLSMLFLIVVSMLMAFFSWKFIEQPFRNREFVNRFTIFFMSFMGGSLFIALGLLGHFYWDRLDTGNYNRLEVSLAMSIDGYQDDNRKLQDDSLNPLRRISGDNNYDLVDDDFDDQLWFEKDGDRHRILLRKSVV